MATFSSWSKKQICFVKLHLFSLFFLVNFLSFPLCFLQLIYTLGVYFCSVVLSVTKHLIFIRCQGSLFSWCRPRGAQNASVVQISLFSKSFFYFLYFFHVCFRCFYTFLNAFMCFLYIFYVFQFFPNVPTVGSMRLRYHVCIEYIFSLLEFFSLLKKNSL